MPFPKIDGYVVTEKLGSGSYSTVYKAYTKVGARSIVAIKCVDKSRIKNSGTAVDNLITEIRLLKTLTHPHIVHMKHFTWDDRSIYIIMEYCCGGDLSKYIQRYGRVPEKQVKYFLQQLASALKFLREKGVVHMDLKPHNLLLHKGSDGKYILKVADFGFAAYVGSNGAGVRGSPLYMAPEMVAGRGDDRVDLWSVGVIMYECLFGKAPYSSNTFKELMDKIHRQAKIEIPPNSSISAGCRQLLTRLLKHDPDERISYEEFFDDEYLDLEHMPSKENYEKAVSLIKQAIEMDCRNLGPASGPESGPGRLEQARALFGLYRDSLRYLVPCVGAETDPVRRGALTDKLNRYMERAEEIKQYIKYAEHGGPSPLAGMETGVVNAGMKMGDSGRVKCPVQMNPVTCCGTSLTTSTSSYHYGHTQKLPCTSCNSAVNSQQQTNNGCCCSTNNSDAVSPDNEPVEIKGRATQAIEEASKANVRSRTPPRFGLKRFFGRQNSVPYLNNYDSSIADNAIDKQKLPSEDSTNDGCRIT